MTRTRNTQEADPPDGLHVRPSRCWLTGDPKWRATYTVEGMPGPTFEDRCPIWAWRRAMEGITRQAWNRSGYSPKTETQSPADSLIGTTAAPATPTDESPNCSSVPEKRSFSEPHAAELSGRGVTSLTIPAKSGSTARSSATKPVRSAANSYDKRMRLLIASGLIKGITRSWTPSLFDLETPDTASSQLAGSGAERRRAAC